MNVDSRRNQLMTHLVGPSSQFEPHCSRKIKAGLDGIGLYGGKLPYCRLLATNGTAAVGQNTWNDG